jgi:hypothetical protein
MSDLKYNILDFQKRLIAGFRKLTSNVTVFLNPKSKVFIDKGDYSNKEECDSPKIIESATSVFPSEN